MQDRGADAYFVTIGGLVGEMRDDSCTKSTIQLPITLYFALHDSLRDTRPKEVAWFPKKTRTALLIDLANRMDFDDAEPTPLQRAFLEVGIRLKDYQGLIPDEPTARSR